MLAILCLGLVYSHHAVVFSGFRITPGNPSDAYLCNYLLEHDYRWVRQMPSHQHFWDTPMFYPHPNTTAYTDTLLGTLPFYAPWRLLGFPSDTSFQLWFLTVGALNYLSCYFLLRKLFGAEEVASNAGAFLFAFAGARIIQEWHPQLTPAFYVVLSFAGICIFFRDESARPSRTWMAIAMFVGGAVAQMYTNFYGAWFLLFGCLIAIAAAALLPSYRGQLFRRLRCNWDKLAIAAAIGTLAVWPMLMHSLAAVREVGSQQYDYVQAMLPGFPSYIKQGTVSWLYGWLDPHIRLPHSENYYEESNGVGLVTSVLVLWGFWIDRRPASKLLAIVAGVIFLSTLRLPNGYSLWRYVYLAFPGAAAMRAVGRVGLFLLFPAAIALAAALNRISSRFSPWAAAICGLLVVAEQGVSPLSYDKLRLRSTVRNVASQVPPSCEAFLFSPPSDFQSSPVLGNTVGLWTQISTAIPTLNAASGAIPPNWPFDDTLVGSDADYRRLRQAILQWEREHPTLREVCWIRPADIRSEEARARALAAQPILVTERVRLPAVDSTSGR